MSRLFADLNEVLAAQAAAILMAGPATLTINAVVILRAARNTEALLADSALSTLSLLTTARCTTPHTISTDVSSKDPRDQAALIIMATFNTEVLLTNFAISTLCVFTAALNADIFDANFLVIAARGASICSAPSLTAAFSTDGLVIRAVCVGGAALYTTSASIDLRFAVEAFSTRCSL